ncbi:peptide-methionine (S)-S-oxide reductase [Propionibacterium cyclohexanicum]|uniref:Peptide methionine sulfoxide reductase MsrA n=1 Tax=Propionibacterium cyclohexanicum TaxID=64702 RepID=A0A1H9RIG2_9ACTN|nr:peptide-methionine (S)-S-oxide reductase MsrA [Propionibacterium cyclohexanicum]SER71803.1 peptide-methionine (S)-S-oxide reductase [Propionibacterium cyclohexanicum]
MLRFERTHPGDAAHALPGRATPVLAMPVFHRVTGDPLDKAFPGSQTAYFAAGCFWGVEKLFWRQPGVLSTAAGYMGGTTPNPSYEEVCTGRTGHAETVRVVFDPSTTTYAALVRVFFENHDPTQANRQGNDVGTQYRSALFTTSEEQMAIAVRERDAYASNLGAAGYGAPVTSIEPAPTWYFAEDYHQQYLEANPNGYCPVHATGVKCTA